MTNFINKEALIGNKHQAVILCEYTHELSLVKQLIEIVDKSIFLKKPENIWTYEGICFLFAKSIVSYTKMAYDNIMLGHFDATNMILRTIIENNVCLDIIQQYKKEELWKYYLVHSYKKMMCFTNLLNNFEENFLKPIYDEYDIEDIFIKKSKKNNSKKPYAYIDKNYGWTYKINEDFTFSGLCNLVDKREYNDFKMLSMYSHGTSLSLKINDSVFIEHIISMISSIHFGLSHLVSIYCLDTVGEDFDTIAHAIETIICNYLNE